jgi:hypothetical protein
MASVLVGLGIVVVCIAALRIAKPEYYSPRCCMGLALQAIKEAEDKDKGEGSAPDGACSQARSGTGPGGKA